MSDQSFISRDCSLASPALFRRIHWKQPFNLVAVRHVQCGRCPQHPGQITVLLVANSKQSLII